MTCGNGFGPGGQQSVLARVLANHRRGQCDFTLGENFRLEKQRVLTFSLFEFFSQQIRIVLSDGFFSREMQCLAIFGRKSLLFRVMDFFSQ